MSDSSGEPSGKLPSGPTSNPSGETTGNPSGKLPTSGTDATNPSGEAWGKPPTSGRDE
jgi:hypothetical protein